MEKSSLITMLTCILTQLSQASVIYSASPTPYIAQTDPYGNGAACVQMVLECDEVALNGRQHQDYIDHYHSTYGRTGQLDLAGIIESHGSLSSFVCRADVQGMEYALDTYDIGMADYITVSDPDPTVVLKQLFSWMYTYKIPPVVWTYQGAQWAVITEIQTDIHIPADPNGSTDPNQPVTIEYITWHDPASVGLSSNAHYSSYSHFVRHIFPQINIPAATAWNGNYVGIADPDPSMVMVISQPIPPGNPYAVSLSPEEAIQAAQDAVTELGIANKPDFEEALAASTPCTPILASWPEDDVIGYIVPFTREDDLKAIVSVYAGTGEFMEAVAFDPCSFPDNSLENFYAEMTYPFVARESGIIPGAMVPVPSRYLEANKAQIKINFQTPASVTPNGYLPDTGQTYGPQPNGYTYGWTDQAPITRERNEYPDHRRDTFAYAETTDHVWEIEVANGTYEIQLACGDIFLSNPLNNFIIEGVTVMDPDGTDHWDEFYLTVDVQDGRLTIEPLDDPIEGIQSKLMLDCIHIIGSCNKVLRADLNHDCKINLDDLSILSQEWLMSENPFKP